MFVLMLRSIMSRRMRVNNGFKFLAGMRTGQADDVVVTHVIPTRIIILQGNRGAGHGGGQDCPSKGEHAEQVSVMRH